MSKEAPVKQIKTSVVNPRWAHPENISDRVRDLTEKGLGTVTIFTTTQEDSDGRRVRRAHITPFHFLEARGLSLKGQEKFIAEITRCMRSSQCVVIQSVIPVQTGSRRKR